MHLKTYANPSGSNTEINTSLYFFFGNNIYYLTFTAPLKSQIATFNESKAVMQRKAKINKHMHHHTPYWLHPL